LTVHSNTELPSRKWNNFASTCRTVTIKQRFSNWIII